MKNDITNSTVTIAIADAFALTRSGTIAILKALPQFKVVVEAPNGLELINKIKTLEHLPDICILEISMQEMNGFDTLIKLKKLFPGIKCLVLTEIEHKFSIIKMIRNGANGYLLKNCVNDILYDAIATIHAHSYYYSAAAPQKLFIAVTNNRLPDLTERELEFLKYCCTELPFKDIAACMHLGLSTIHDYQKKVGEKLNLHSRTALALFAIASGIVPHNSLNHPNNSNNN